MKTTTSALEQVSTLAGMYLTRKATVEKIEEQLKAAKRELEEVEMFLLPEAMEQANVVSFTTPDDIQVSIKEDLNMSIKAGNKALAISWLRNHGKGDLVKNKVAVEFGKGQDAQAVELANMLRQQGYEYTQNEDVHTSSVKAVIRKVLEDGAEDVPLEVFGATQYKKAIVKIK